MVLPFIRGRYVSHEYTNCVSILKFIETNWGLGTISGRCRDNLPNPVQSGTNPYVPVSGLTIGDLMSLVPQKGTW